MVRGGGPGEEYSNLRRFLDMAGESVTLLLLLLWGFVLFCFRVWLFRFLEGGGGCCLVVDCGGSGGLLSCRRLGGGGDLLR